MDLQLVSDRTQADADAVKRLESKGWAALSDDERAAWLRGMKGAYNASDLNRVGSAMQAISDALNAAGYFVKVAPKTDWTQADIPTTAQLSRVLNDLSAIRGVLAAWPEMPDVPDSMERMTFAKANDIERILAYVNQSYENIEQIYSGETYSGEYL